MTLEHKILMLIDRGVTSASDISEILERAPDTMNTLLGLLGNERVVEVQGRRDFLALTSKGLDRLNAIDEASDRA